MPSYYSPLQNLSRAWWATRKNIMTEIKNNMRKELRERSKEGEKEEKAS